MTAAQACVAAAIAITVFGFMPQIIKILATKKCDDVSMAQPIMISAGMLLWTVYGVMVKDAAIIFSNVTVFCLNAAVIGLKLFYPSTQNIKGKPMV